jgi:hypothetical protein
MSQQLTKAEVRQILVSFLDGSGGPYDWDDFTSMRITDPFLDHIRDRCERLWDEFPSERPNEYCSDSGTKIIEQFIKQLSPSDSKIHSET